MSISDLIVTALRAIRTNIGRSLLTILGIVIGVAAIALVMSLGAGARQLIISQVQSVGADTLVVIPGRQPNGPSEATDTLLSDSLTTSDVEAIQRAAPSLGITSAQPVVFVTGSVSRQSEVYRPTILGWNAEAIGAMFDLQPEKGVLFGEEESRAYAKQAVIGQNVYEKLFDGQEAIGQTIRIKNTFFRVVGVLPKRGQVSFFNFDEVVLIPPTTAQREIMNINHFHRIMVKANSAESVDNVAEDLAAFLRDRHSISDPSKDDFFIQTQQALLDQIKTITQVLTIFLTSIATISLIVGGVGIMNIMLVSVTERTREIGLRKALGAQSRDILWQFLLEALFLTLSGGLLGTAIAVVVSATIAVVLQRFFALEWNFQLPLTALALGLGMAGFVGVTFGIYPARRASRLSPIEALRYE